MISTIKTDEDIRDCENVKDLGDLLDLDLKKLFFLSYKNRHLYKSYKIKKKSGGYRDIHAPNEALKTVCKKLNYYFNKVYEEYLPNAVHGFVEDRDIISNAKKHLERNYILNIDLDNFFGTVNSGRIMGLLGRHPFRFGKNLKSVIVGLTTHNNSLPQGSPCSPVLANMVCLKLDKEMIKLSSKYGWRYTRYADDISISSRRLDDNLALIKGGEVLVGERIISIIRKNGFFINDKKTRLATPRQSKWVTGIKVNEKLNISRKRIRQTRSMLNAWEVYKENLAEVEFNTRYNSGKKKVFREVLRGRIDHIGNVRGKTDLIYIKLFNRLCNLENKLNKRLPETKKEEYQNKILIIKSSLGYGSGFFIDKNFFVTCAHVVGKDKNVLFTTADKMLSVEFKGASVVHVDERKDFALFRTNSDFKNLIFKCNRKKSYQSFSLEEEYVAIGYGGFRSDKSIWTKPIAIDQKILQKEKNSFLVGSAMWSGMSGGPVISKETGCVDGYIVRGAKTQEKAKEVRSFEFYPISNIPKEYFDSSRITR